MIKVLKVTEDGEFAIENGDFVWLTELNAVEQLIWQTLRVFKGEVSLDTTVGVDYYNKILPLDAEDLVIIAELDNAVESIPIEGITVTATNLSREQGKLYVDMDIKCVLGELSIRGEL